MESRILIGVALCAVACSKPKHDAAAAPDAGKPLAVVGVDPEKFQCASIASDAELAATLGAPVHVEDTGFTPPRGTPAPCAYLIQHPGGDAGSTEEAWSFDFDCRANYADTADKMFAQFASQAQEQQAAYAAAAGSGKKPPMMNDAGVVAKAPEAVATVQVGKKAMDMMGAILFVDDDAPCYVRVSGPDAARRLALAQLVAKNLTVKNAPTGERVAPVNK